MIDYSTYTDTELTACFANLDRQRFPENLAALERELLMRGLSGVPTPAPAYPAAQNLFETPEAMQILRDRMDGKVPPQGNHSTLMILGIVAFLVITSLRDDWMYAACLIPILLLHELGHLVAMKSFGFRNVSIFFIPFFGAMTSGIPTNTSRKKEAIISLAGPAVGIGFGALSLLANQFFPSKALIYFANYSFMINLFNLLPILPFDGGHYWDALLASRNFILSMAFKVMTVGGLVWAAVELGSWVMGLLAWYIVVQINEQRLEQAAKNRLDFGKLAGPNQLSDDALRQVIRAVLAVTKNPTEERSIPIIADRVVRLGSNLSIPSAPWPFTIGALIGYGLLVTFGIALYLSGHSIR